MGEKNLQLETMRLCKLWLDLLNHAGEYAKRYYMARALERPFGESYYGALNTLDKSYKTKGNLDKEIQRDLDSFPAELLAIRDAQIACELPAFSDRRGYLDQIMMGLTMIDRHGKERRAYYRRQFDKLLKSMTKGQATALSLNQLEEKFQEKLRKDTERKTKKAA